MKTKIIMTVIALVLTLDAVLAVQIYSTQKLNDGTTIKKCRYDNGKIDYCTQQDALKAIEVFNNPEKYMTPQEKALLEKNNKEAAARREAATKVQNAQKEKFQTEFPIAKKIEVSLSEYEKEQNELQRKKDLGLPYNESRYSILSSKIEILEGLNRGSGSGDYTNPAVTGYSSLTITGIRFKYNDLINKLNNKEITQEEFNYLKAKLVLAAGELENSYNIVIKTEGIVDLTRNTINHIDNFETSNNFNNVYEKTKVEKINNGLNNGVNMLNNTMNNVRVIKGLFGKY